MNDALEESAVIREAGGERVDSLWRANVSECKHSTIALEQGQFCVKKSGT